MWVCCMVRISSKDWWIVECVWSRLGACVYKTERCGVSRPRNFHVVHVAQELHKENPIAIMCGDVKSEAGYIRLMIEFYLSTSLWKVCTHVFWSEMGKHCADSFDDKLCTIFSLTIWLYTVQNFPCAKQSTHCSGRHISSSWYGLCQFQVPFRINHHVLFSIFNHEMRTHDIYSDKF